MVIIFIVVILVSVIRIQLEGIEMPVQDMGPILGEVMKGSYRYVDEHTDDL